MDQIEQLTEENRRLREDNERLRSMAQKKSQGLSCWVYGLIAGGVVAVSIPVIAILAAIALPMYSTFKQKSKVGATLQSLQATKTGLTNWYNENGTFSEIIMVPPVGGRIKVGSTGVGAGLSKVEGCSYQLISTTGAVEDDTGSIVIAFNWEVGSGCPKSSCDGVWTLTCSKSSNDCQISATVGDGSLGMNIP